MARPLLLLVIVLSLEACATTPPPRPPRPPQGTRSWDVSFPGEDEELELRVGELRLKFTRLQPVVPIGGLERGESNFGVGIDVLGIGASFGDEEPVRDEPVAPVDAEARAFRELGQDLDRSIERVHEAAKRAADEEPAP